MSEPASKPTRLPDDDRTTATGLWTYAESYLEAANFVAKGCEANDCELRHKAPIYFLYAHAIELAFKAFLRSTGVTPKKLRDCYGHSLISLMDACETKGLREAGRSVELDRAVVEWLDQERMDFRYIRTGYKSVASLEKVREVATRLVRATRAVCVHG
jgi:hypothetical protein